MQADPNPNQTLGPLFRHGAMLQPHACRPEYADAFQPEGWMSWVALQQFKIFIGQALSVGG